jgi:3'-5' exoribonuclease
VDAVIIGQKDVHQGFLKKKSFILPRARHAGEKGGLEIDKRGQTGHYAQLHTVEYIFLPRFILNMDKTQFIADLKNGQEVASLFALASVQQGQAKNGPFWKLVLCDASGSLEAKIWSPQSQAYPELAAGDMAEILGRVTTYRDRLEIAVDRMRILSPEEKNGTVPGDFMPASKREGADMLEELRSLCRAQLSHAPWKKLVLGLLNDDEIISRLMLAPAAKGMHHAYAGGLLEHTLAVTRLCLLLAGQYPELDREVLVAGAVCHDLGKLWELAPGLSIDYTGEGRLLGHIQIALDYLEPRIAKSGLEHDLALHLKHLVLSHHGQHEYGSPRLPSTAEAMILHYADNIDAKMNQIRNALNGIRDGDSGWSAFTPGLDRFLFQAVKTPEKPGKARPQRNAREDADENVLAAERESSQLSLLSAG